MRVYPKTRVSLSDILQFFYSQIPTRYVDMSINGRSVSLKVQTYEELVLEKQKLFNDAVSHGPRDEAIRYISENLKPCRFIVFQSKNTPYFFQFGRRHDGLFLDYVINKIELNKKHLERTVNYLNAKGFHETDVDTWEYKGYFFAQDKDLRYINVFFKEDTARIADCIAYLTVEVCKEDFSDFRVICG